jgi:hypothetical protein
MRTLLAVVRRWARPDVAGASAALSVADVAKTDLFLRIGVSFGSRSLMGGVIFVMPITFTIAFNAPRIDPSTCDEVKGRAVTDRVIQREHGIPVIQRPPVAMHPFLPGTAVST